MNAWIDHSFVKMHGSGNDFILLDNRDDRLEIPVPTSVVRVVVRDGGIYVCIDEM